MLPNPPYECQGESSTMCAKRVILSDGPFGVISGRKRQLTAVVLIGTAQEGAFLA